MIQLFVATVLPLSALLLLITFGSARLHQSEMQSLLVDQTNRAARAAAVIVEERLARRLEAARALAARGPDALEGGGGTLVADFDRGIAFVGEDGRVTTAAEFSPDLLAQLPPDFLPRAGGATDFSPTLSDSVTGEPVLLAVAPEHGEWLLGAFSVESITHDALDPALGSHGQATALVVDSHDRILYEAGALSPMDPPSSHTGVQAARRGEEGVLVLPGPAGSRVMAYQPIPSTGWSIIVEVSLESALSPYLRTTVLAPLALAPLFALVGFALWFAARQVVLPLQTLQRRASELAWGRSQAIEQPVGGINEIRQLQEEMVRLDRKVRAAQQGLRGYIGAITNAQEEERRRLARELHDDTLQSLIALHQRLQIVRGSLSDPGAVSSVDETEALLHQTIENLRRATRALRPLYLEELGLVTALQALADEVAAQGGPSVEFHSDGAVRRPTPYVELALYRVAQEALSNVVRHAQARHAFVRLSFEDRAVELSILDDGVGFELPETPADFARGGHYGLLGLQERAELLGAELHIHSLPGEGTRLTFRVPSGEKPSAPSM
ncbi:MAG TPA: ATP-binding protein [Anaerolineales bacterium]